MIRTERVLISLSPKARKSLERLAKAMNKPVSRVAGEMLEEASPMIDSLAKAAEDIASKKADAYMSVSAALAQSQANAAQLAVDFHTGAAAAMRKPRKGKK